MSTREHQCQCPFLNRSDSRCSEVFSLDGLRHVFGHCFDAYSACPMYREMLAERRLRRSEAKRGGEYVAGRASTPYVPLTIAGGYAERQSGAEGLPDVPGFRTGTHG